MKTRPDFQRMLAWLLLAMAATLFAMQLRSLFIFPELNSFRWFGDETWLMTEAKQQITTGIVRYPLAIGSTLEHGKGLVLSMTWLSALLYGLPAWIAGTSPVAIGRVVTAVLAISLLAVLYGSARTLGASRCASTLAILLLVSTRSFFFASHSARPDLLAGLMVLAFVTICTKMLHLGKERSARWWFGYGAIVVFFALSSSIHLLTLLGPVSLYFFWRLGGATKWNYAASAFGGAVIMMFILVIVYYSTTGNIALFSSSIGPVQFHDVLSSIPIRRPFSRSVQIANIIIRFKQFVTEAPQLFLLPVLLPFVWKRASSERHTFASASLIVLLSWLLLEGAEINYSMHLLPLFFLGLAIAATVILSQWNRVATTVLSGLAILVFIFGFRDSIDALDAASRIDQSNRAGVQTIEAKIAAESLGAGKPRVMTEPFALERLSLDTNIEIMTDHFISFTAFAEPLDSFLHREHVNFAVLYNSPVYPKNRVRDDPFYQGIMRNGQLVASYIGTTGDMGRDYFDQSNWKHDRSYADTLLLFRLSR